MQRSKPTKELPECRNGCLVVVRVVVLHLAVAQAATRCVPASMFIAVSIWITGLIVGIDPSTTAMAEALPLLSHDALTRMLSGRWWSSAALRRAGVWMTKALGEGWLILDDVHIPKPYAKAIAFCGWDFDHALNRNSFGIRIVFLVWSNGTITIPLGFLVWQKDLLATPRRKGRKRGPKRKRRPRVSPKAKRIAKRAHRVGTGARYRSKNELAKILVWQARRAGVAADRILFDNWYASRQNLRFLRRLGLSWATRLKKNTRVLYNGQPMTVAQLAATVPKSNYHYYARLRARARSFPVTALGVEIKLTVVKDDSHPERDRTKYVASDLLTLSCAEHVEWYRRRWPVECFFRDCKQLLSLGRLQARSPDVILTHMVLVCIAYVLLQLLKPLGAVEMVSVIRSRNALVRVRLLVRIDGALELARLLASGRFEPIDLDHVCAPLRTRLSATCLPKTFNFP